MRPTTCAALVARAEARRAGADLADGRASLRRPGRSGSLIPAFVFFFQMLYPFALGQRPRRSQAGGCAGGCMLVEREALERAGGIAAMRAEIIDDCALGALMKRQGPIWLGLTRRARSLRPYPRLRRDSAAWSRVRPMRSSLFAARCWRARWSPWLWFMSRRRSRAVRPRAGAIGSGWLPGRSWRSRIQPMLRFYRRLAALGPGACRPSRPLYHALHRAARRWQIWRGRGGLWKGRVQADRRATHDRRRRLRIGQRPQGRELSRSPRGSSRRVARRRSWPSTVSRAPPTTSPTMQPPSRTRSSRFSTAWKRRCSASPTPSPKALPLRATLQARGLERRATRSTCWPPSVATSPSPAMPTGTN